MLSFARILKKEQAPIGAALRAALDRLPAPVRGVAGESLLAEGKRLRPLLTLTSARLFGRDDADVYTLAATLEMIHAASLMHDDVLDGADLRRGRPACHTLHGVSACLLAGDALMAEASRTVAAFGNTAMVECVAETIVRTVAGEVREIELQGSLEHGMDDYLDIVAGKTGWLIRAAGRLGALFAGAPANGANALSDFCLELGLAFQMVDDALDFADEKATGKPTGGDLREGKLTPPIMLLIETLSGAEKADFAHKFAHGGWTDAEIAALARRIRDNGFDAKARALADERLRRAESFLPLLPDRPERKIFRNVLAYVRDRGM